MQIIGPFNEKDGGSLRGFELAYQTIFDFLPGLLNGLGMQANYTYVKQEGINNANLADAGGLAAGSVGAYGAGVTSVQQPTIDSHRLAGISDHTFNLVGLYEKVRSPFVSRTTGARAISPTTSIAASACRSSRRLQASRWLDPLLAERAHRALARSKQSLEHDDRLSAGNLWRLAGHSQRRRGSTGIPAGRASTVVTSLVFASSIDLVLS